jgi:hypothetical protein
MLPNMVTKLPRSREVLKENLEVLNAGFEVLQPSRPLRLVCGSIFLISVPACTG